jgi:tellurite resistance protein TerC
LPTYKALSWAAFWIDLALGMDVIIFLFLGKEKALEFLSGYIIEQSLSIDNLFLFLIIFSSFGIKREYQRKVLNYGIIGAIILRLVFIGLGVTIVNQFHCILYVFGGILIISGINMMFKKEEKTERKDSVIIQSLSKIVPVTENLVGDKFFIKKNKLIMATPLFAILILIEFSDILFAIDSIPAIFSVSTDPSIVFLSNIAAILGLRSMYFVLGKIHEKFKYVKYAVAAILIFTGMKLSLLIFNIHITTQLSLLIIFSILCVSIVASVIYTLGNEAGY